MIPAGGDDDRPEVIDRVGTPRGELVLRRHGDEHEIISNGVFLMDTRETASARELVRAALERSTAPSRLLIGGLGVGISLAEALADDRVRQVDVVEVEEAVIRWNRTHLAAVHGGALGDPRVRVIHADLVAWLAVPHGAAAVEPYDVVCLDIDNGPGWTVTEGNLRLYQPPAFGRVLELLVSRGILSVWSAARDAAFEDLMRQRVADLEVREIRVPRGEPDIVYVGRRPPP